MLIPKLAVEFKNGTYPISNIAFLNHQMIIDGKAVDTHFDGSYYLWTRETENGQQEHGALKLFSHGIMGSGVVSVENKSIPFTANAMIDYVVSLDHKEWMNFEIGFVEDAQGQKHAFGKFVIPDDPKGTDDFNSMTKLHFTIVQNDKNEDVLSVHFDVDPSYCSFGFCSWISGDFNFTMDYSKFFGKIYAFDLSKPDYHGDTQVISGVYKDTPHITALKDSVLNFAEKQPLKAPLLKSSSGKIPENMLTASGLTSSIENSVEDLFTLPTPDMENMHQLSFAKLKSLMLYTINDDWRKWFGETKPDVGPTSTLTQADVNLLNNDTIKSFLTDKFAVGYLTQAFSQSEAQNIKDQFAKISGYKDKLNYFWKGTDNTCFAKEAGYNQATAFLMDSAFVSCVPGLTKYLTDSPADWAEKLYKYCTTPFTLNGLALQNSLDGRKRLTHLCSVLHSLDQEAKISTDDGKKITYGTALYSRVMDVRLNFIIERFSSDNKEEGVEFLTEYFKQYFNSLLAGDKWKDEVLNAARQDLNELMAEYEVDNVNSLVERMGDIIADSLDVLIRLKDLPLPARINTWAKNNPKLSKALGRTMTIAVYGLGIFASIQAFMGWKDLKPQEKSQAVVDIVDVTANIFSDITKFTAASKLSSAQTAMTELMQAGTDIQNAVELESFTKVAGKIGVKVEEELNDLAASALGRAGEVAGEALVETGESLTQAEKIAATATRWTTISKVAVGFAEGMTILALGAACVCIGFQIANDFATNQPVALKVLDIMEMVANGVAFLAEGAIGIAALAGIEVCSVIPIIGVVAVVVGIAIAIITLFIHRNPPPTPGETFISEHSKPFIDAIAQVPQTWLNAQEKIERYQEPKPVV